MANPTPEHQGLRERIAEALLDPLKCCTVAPFPLTPIHGTCKNCWADALAVADLVLAALAGDPGDLPAQMTDAIRAYFESDAAICVGFDATEAAAAVMGVRDEQMAATVAENARLRAERDHAVGELESRRYHHARWERAEAEMGRLRNRVTALDARTGVSAEGDQS